MQNNLEESKGQKNSITLLTNKVKLKMDTGFPRE